MFLKFEMYLETAVLPRVGDRVAIGCLEKLQLEPGRVSCKCYLFKCFNVWIQMFKVFIQMLASLFLNVFTLEGWGRQWSGQGPPFSSGRSGRLLSTRLQIHEIKSSQPSTGSIAHSWQSSSRTAAGPAGRASGPSGRRASARSCSNNIAVKQPSHQGGYVSSHNTYFICALVIQRSRYGTSALNKCQSVIVIG